VPGGSSRPRDMLLDVARAPEPVDPREALRRAYRPSRVRVLFVGESAPASGRFFYQQDSGLFRAARDAYLAAFPSVPPERFLDDFAERGCWLVDLCAKPVDDLAPPARRRACRDGEAALTAVLGELRPPAIVVLLRSIARHVDRSVAAAGWRGERLDLPYPGRWAASRRRFVDGLVPSLERWSREVLLAAGDD